MRIIVFIICMMICLLALTEWTIFGLLTLAGLIGLVENIKWLKWLVYRTSTLWDILIFGATIVATVKLGVTITASLTIASIGFTFGYRPYIQAQRAKQISRNKQFKHRL
jgi:hypothetical protein